MASVGDLTVELDLDVSDFQRNMDRMQSRMGGLGRNISSSTSSFAGFDGVLSSVGGSLSSISGMLAGGLATGGAIVAIQALTSAFSALGGAIKNVITEGIGYNSYMESSTIAFDVMLGSMSKAEKMMSDISQFAGVTPFSTEALVSSAKVMKSFGIETESIMDNLRMLGDVALGDSEKLKSLTLAFSQITGAGKLQGDNLNQLIDAGFNPLKIIAKETGEEYADLRKIMEKGGITAEMVALAFQRTTSEGGRHFKGMEKLSKSFEGRMSTLADTMDILKGKLVKPFFDFLSSNVLPKIQVLLDNVISNLPDMTNTFNTILSEVKPIFESLSNLIKELWSEMKEGITLIEVIGFALKQTFNIIWQTIKTASVIVIDAIRVIIASIDDVIQIIVGFGATFYHMFAGNSLEATKAFEKVMSNFKSFFVRIWSFLGSTVKNVVSGMVNAFKGFGLDVGAIYNKVFSIIARFYNEILDMTDLIIKGLNLIPKVNIESTKFRINPNYDFVEELSRGFDKMFLLNKETEKNNKITNENIEMKKENVDWSKKFNALLKDGQGDAKKLAKTLETLASKIKSTADNFSNFVNIFDKVKRVRISATSVFRRLEGQVLEMRKWRDALAVLREKLGQESPLFQQLAKEGPAKAGQIIALSRATDQQLEQYRQLFAEKESIALGVAGVQEAGARGLQNSQVNINITGNNINDTMDVDIIANRIMSKLRLAGVQ